jgi:hypothetical protein
VDKIAPALLALAGVLVGILATRELEYLKWQRARRDDVRRDIRATLGDLASTLARMAHSLMWFTYQTLRSGGPPSPNVLESHESEIHELISGAVALQVKLAALDKSTYERVAPYVSTLINLSEDVDAAVDTYTEREKPTAAELQACNERALDYVKKLPSEIANLLG